jgi:hypothetical protein
MTFVRSRGLTIPSGAGVVWLHQTLVWCMAPGIDLNIIKIHRADCCSGGSARLVGAVCGNVA